MARGLAVGYGARVVLRDVDVCLAGGELACVLGPNGTGKSTLLRTLAGMQPRLAGSVELDGHDVQRLPARDLARRVSVVLTERAEVGLLRAYDLVALGRYPYTGWAGRMRSHDHAVVAWALEATGASDLASRDVSELSDGERQRVMIARALAQEPVVLLLDEPTAFLDVARRVEVTTLLRGLARDTGRAVLFSTHELDLALRTADSVWLLDTAGRVRVGAPEDLVLDGSFARSFEVEGLTFDTAAGRFVSHGASVGRARVRGNGVTARWTRRALEREGYEVVDDGPVDVDVAVLDGPAWRLDGREVRSLGELSAAVRHLGQDEA